MSKKSFTLVMLGTGTKYSPQLKNGPKGDPKPVVDDYPKGELLSVIASLIQTERAQINPDSFSPYQCDEVAVINGPVLKGTDVGDKIAQGLAAALKAIARGQTTINIIAHSRGAVESILLALEMEEIQKIIGSCDTLEQVLDHPLKAEKKKSGHNTPPITATLKSLLPQDKAEQESWFADLKNNVPDTRINFFGIDPVPGDFPLYTWFDEFFTLPKIINHTELIYYENEHSALGFTPIYPVQSDPAQKVRWLAMPGHHGTGSNGNNGSQQNKVVSPAGSKATHVQKLMLYKLFDFLSQHGVEFKKAPEVFKEHRALGKKYASMIPGVELTPDNINITQLDFPEIYRKLYNQIAKNSAAYEAFNKTNYPYTNLVAQRKVQRADQTLKFNELFPVNSGYVNDEHYNLIMAFFLKLFLTDTSNSLTEKITTANTVLETNINQIAGAQPSDFILATPKTRQDFLDLYTEVIKKMSQQYLSNDWSKAEKLEVFHAIITLFNNLDELSNKYISNTTIQFFIAELIKLSKLGITDTLKQQHKGLADHFAELENATESRIEHFANLYSKMQVLIDDLMALDKEFSNEQAIFNYYELSLHQKIRTLIKTAAERFYQARANDLPELAPKGSFQELAERYAINHYDVRDRVLEENILLKQQLEALKKGANTTQTATGRSYYFWRVASAVQTNKPPETPDPVDKEHKTTPP